MTSIFAEEFGKKVLTDFDALRNPFVTASRGVNESIQTGHPLYDGLEVGQRQSCQMASVFLDLTNFTGRTFWDEPGAVADLAHAVLGGFTDVVHRLGGHVLGLRGDGLFAGFGPHQDPRIAVALASLASAAALDVIQNGLNPALKQRGLHPVQARAGCDFGEAVFIRTGNAQVSEVNIIGFASNFAAKCEKAALSWEVVVGEGFASFVANATLLTNHEASPKTYTRNGQDRQYRFYDYKWRPLLSELESTVVELAGRPLETV